MATHCQICARAIKAGSGVIATHGYTQPDRWRGGYGSGWRTRDCFGSHHVPYEDGHDALDWFIERLNKWIPESEAVLAKHFANPPAEYTVGPDNPFGGGKRWSKVVGKPDDFDSSKRPVSMTPWTYATEFWSVATGIERDIRGMKRALADATKRLEEWKPPFTLSNSVAFPG